jgi:hypothetical protein
MTAVRVELLGPLRLVTLRNLAALLRRLGDEESAVLLDAAADQAPDAPPAGSSPTETHRTISRAEVLAIAREALRKHLR